MLTNAGLYAEQKTCTLTVKKGGSLMPSEKVP